MEKLYKTKVMDLLFSSMSDQLEKMNYKVSRTA